MSKWFRRFVFGLTLLSGLTPVFGQMDPRDVRDSRARDARTVERETRRPGERDVRPGERDIRPGERDSRPGGEVRPLEAKEGRPSEQVRPDTKKAGDEAARQAKSEQLKENLAKGEAWEDKTAQYVEQHQKGDSWRQVTIESKDGTRSRADMIYEKSDGTYALVEAKASDTARYTENQKEVFNRIGEGQKVTVRGDNMGDRAGKQITISEVWVSRPDAGGEVRMDRYKSVEVKAASN